jgi:hypothetical protein
MMRAYEFLQANGPSILLLLVVPILIISLIIWRVWRVSPRIGKSITVVLILASAAFVVGKSISPAGKYRCPYCEGIYVKGDYRPDEWIELSGGVYYGIVDGRRYPQGSYFKKDHGWVLQRGKRPDGGVYEQELSFSVVGLVINPPIVGHEVGEESIFTRRRIIPFSRPQWFPRYLE